MVLLALVLSIMSLAMASSMEYLVSWASRYLDTCHLYGIPLWDGLRMLCISRWTTRDPEIAGPDERSRSPDLRVRSPDPGSEMGPKWVQMGSK